MKTARISLAIASGALLGLAWIASSDHEKLDSPRILVGILFGAANAATMIAREERLSPKIIYYIVVPLVIALIIHEGRTGTAAEAVITTGVGIAFVAVQLAMASLAMESSASPTAEADPAAPAVKE